jgi:hypothetical protein
LRAEDRDVAAGTVVCARAGTEGPTAFAIRRLREADV